MDAHTITSVKLKLYRYGSPGTITIAIKGTTDGKPSGADLCSGTTDGDTLTDSSPGEWREITLGAGAALESGVQYAIVIKVLGGDGSNYVLVRCDASSPTYAYGNFLFSFNSGVDWTGYTTLDALFEDIGNSTTYESYTTGDDDSEPVYGAQWAAQTFGQAIVTHEWTGSDGIALTDALVKNPIKAFSDGIALADVLVKMPIKVLSDAIALSDVLEKVYTYVRSFTDGIAIADTLVKSVSKVLTDGIAFTDTLLKLWVHGVLRILNAVRNLPSVREEGKKR